MPASGENRMITYHGQCSCRKVSFIGTGEPLFTQYCHCTKCREVALMSQNDQDKVGYSYTAAYLTHNFSILSGENNLESLIRKNAKLLLCSSCKSLIYGISLDPAMQGGIGVNANNFNHISGIPDSFQPVRHIWYANHVINFNDTLPKFTDAPKDQLGTGELYEENVTKF